MVTNHLENYLQLLKIRHKGKRWVTIIIGVVFLIFFIWLIAEGMLGKSNSKAMYLNAAMIICFSFGFLENWVRLEIIKETMKLIDTLLLMYE